MAKTKILTDTLIEDIKRVGTGSFSTWLSENQVSLPVSDNLFDSLEEALTEETIELDIILSGIAELEESSDKKIFLLQVSQIKVLVSDLKKTLINIKKTFGYSTSTDDTKRIKAGNGPTFAYLFVSNDLIKIKFSEIHYDREDDLINDKFIRVPKNVNVYFMIDLKSGFTQIRFDAPGQIHTHLNDLNKPSELAYQAYYKDLLTKLFPEIIFTSYKLDGVSNYISKNEKKRFRMRKEVTTVSDGAKQTYSTSKKLADVRLLKEHIGAAANDNAEEWLTEDISGYWLASESDGELKKDLFMRIYRRDSELRVQRGCLKKELDYGIGKIREIQKAI